MANISKIKIGNTTYDIKDATARTNITNINTSLANKLEASDIANFITASVDNLVNYYTKSQVYTKTEVDGLVEAIHQFQFVVASTLPTASADTMYKIYLIPSANSQTQNVKDEYITVENSGTYSWEQIGSTTFDASNYVTITALNSALASYQPTLTFDNTPTANSNNPVKSSGIKSYVDTGLSGKQNVLTFDSTPTADSANPVTSGGVKSYVDTGLSGKQNSLTFDSTPTASSTNPVTSGGVKTYVDNNKAAYTVSNEVLTLGFVS